MYREKYPRLLYFGKRTKHSLVKVVKGGNKLRTSRYTNLNWIPVSLFYQLKKVANIYFVLITILTFIPNSPKKPPLQILTLFVMLAILVIKDDREDKQRRQFDKELNEGPANLYRFGILGFT